MMTANITEQAPAPLAAAKPAGPPEVAAGPFLRSDYLGAAFVFLVTLGVYIATLAPSVTVQDSGELITGAARFGVPHPPGYPLWTISGFLISMLVPIGNLAWRINLESALFGAASNACLSLLAIHSSRWLLLYIAPTRAELIRRAAWASGVTAGLVLGFTDVMWSQSVISEVYTLNALALILSLLFFYRWMSEPERPLWLLSSVLVFSLGLTNHHTLLELLAAFLLGGLLIACEKFPRNFASRFPALLLGMMWLALAAQTLLTSLSDDESLEKIGYRTAVIIVSVTAATGFFFMREWRWQRFIAGALIVACIWWVGSFLFGGEITLALGYGIDPNGEWLKIEEAGGVILFLLACGAGGWLGTSMLDLRVIYGIVLVGVLGLTPYAYLPFASSTTPPMNWGYASEPDGLYKLIVRAQYDLSLDSMIRKFVGPVVGAGGGDTQIFRINQQGDGGSPVAQRIGYVKKVTQAIWMYGYSLSDNITSVLIFLTIPLLGLLGSMGWRRMAWLVFLLSAWLTAAFLLTMLAPPPTLDRNFLSATKVFNLQSHAIYILMMGNGLACLWLLAARTWWRYKISPSWCAASLFLALLPLSSNVVDNSQSSHWFGYQFGHEILSPMEKNAIFFGGSDAGRFVPTYMIFCESTQPRQFKTDPDFDRRDIFVITQNALGDLHYLKYLRDQYDARFRPRQWTAFERWLGRESQYPPESIGMLTDDDFNACFPEYAKATGQDPNTPLRFDSVDSYFIFNGVVAKKIFDANKDKHAFYVEEMYNIPWMLPYLTPWGAILKLNPEPLDSIPPAIVARDRAYWDARIAELKANPAFLEDDDAQYVYGKARATISKIYRYRNMMEEAEYASRQAVELAPTNAEQIGLYADTLAARNKWTEALKVLDDAMRDDPLSDYFPKLINGVKDRRDVENAFASMKEQWDHGERNVELAISYLQALAAHGGGPNFDKTVEECALLPDTPPDRFANLVGTLVDGDHAPKVLSMLRNRATLRPSDMEVHYLLASIAAREKEKPEALRALEAALHLDSAKVLKRLPDDRNFDFLRGTPDYENVIAGKPYGALAPLPPVTNTAEPPKKPAGKVKRK